MTSIYFHAFEYNRMLNLFKACYQNFYDIMINNMLDDIHISFHYKLDIIINCRYFHKKHLYNKNNENVYQLIVL